MSFLFPGRKKQKEKVTTEQGSTIAKPKPKSRSKSTINKQIKKEDSDGPIITKCLCCGTRIRVPTDLAKFKCSVCYTSNPMRKRNNSKPMSADSEFTKENRCSLKLLNQLINECYQNGQLENSNGKEFFKFEAVSRYLTECFHDIDILERSFTNINSPIFINIDELNEFYFQVMNLPTRKPFYRMICACNDILKKPTEQVERFRWIYIIWQNPVVRSCLTLKQQCQGYDSPHIKAVGYELVKRCIGYLSSVLESKNHKLYLTYLKNLPDDIFLYHIETINLYLTYQLTKLYSDNNRSKIHKKKKKNVHNTDQNIITGNRLSLVVPLTDVPQILNESHLSLSDDELDNDDDNASSDSKSMQDINELKKNQPRIKAQQYQHNWHIETAVKTMAIYYHINCKREIIGSRSWNQSKKLSIGHFYNTMLDFIDFRQDFNNWKGLEVKKQLKELFQAAYLDSKKFSFCWYPFLLSLGVKISIMEFETRKIMEYQAEMAFLDSLDKGKMVPLYFKIQVRRKYIVSDSLKMIKEHQGDLLKALRVQFVNEPGIDAGGLRKEWFMLLTKEFFSRRSGLFAIVPESRYSWFSQNNKDGSSPFKNIEKLYFLFGVVIGLAIFNGVILDIKFPKLFYKKMCNEPLTFGDYQELYPETGNNLQKLLNYDQEDFVDVFGLTFETTVEEKSTSDKLQTNPSTVELCKNGSKRRVTLKNKQEYVHSWINYYLDTSVRTQFHQFMKGFRQVFNGCNSIDLFNCEELERLLCGDIQEKAYDLNMLRSVTKYSNGFSDDSPTVEWFWIVISKWSHKLQSKLLQFVTGSDRIPATGINTLTFKISRLRRDENTMLPIAHTCFNELALCEYDTIEILESKLITAITESQGFEFR